MKLMGLVTRNGFVQAVLLTLLFCPVFSQNTKIIDGISAVVGDKILMHSEIESQLVSMKAQGVTIDEKSRCALVNELLFQKLLLHHADLDSVVISDDQVEGEMDRRMSYFIAQIGSEKQMELYYKKSILEIKEELRENVKEQLVGQMMHGKITSNIAITPKEVKNYYNGLNQDSIPLVNAEVEMAHILINAKKSEKSKEIAKGRLGGIKERITNGEDFSTLAVLYSEDEGSAKKGGELGFLGRGELVPEFAAVAFKLKNDNVSEIVETKFGFHIIQLIKRRGQKVNVRHILIKHQLDEEQVRKAKNLADSVYNILQKDSLSFEKAALLFSDDETTAKSNGVLINPQTGTSIYEMDQVEAQFFYIIDNLDVAEISKPVPAESITGEKGYRIMKLLKRSDAHKANLEKDYDKIQNAALVSKQDATIRKWKDNKIGETYIKVDEKYKGCKFYSDWKR